MVQELTAEKLGEAIDSMLNRIKFLSIRVAKLEQQGDKMAEALDIFKQEVKFADIIIEDTVEKWRELRKDNTP